MTFPPTDYQCALPDHIVHYAQAGSGEILLIIHGSLCDYRYWRWQLPALGESFHVLAPSLRGYWPTAFPQANPRFSIQQHAQDMTDFIARISAGRPVHILGHSRGAQVAMHLAMQAPEQVRSLTLADPGFRLLGEPEVPLFHDEMARLLREGDVDAAMSGFVDKANGAGTWKQMTTWFKTMVKDNRNTLLSQAIEDHPVVDPQQFAKLACPVLLIGGAMSPERYKSRIAALLAARQDAMHVTIPLAAHGMNLANPRAFNHAVSDFLVKTTEPGYLTLAPGALTSH